MPTRNSVCLVGPPASGKTTLAQALAHRFGGVILRIATLLDAAALEEPRIADLIAASRDDLGWVSDHAVELTLEHCLRADHPIGASARSATLAIIDNFPGRASQVPLLARVLHEGQEVLSCGLVSVRMTASDEMLYRRRETRRTCSRCDVPSAAPRCGRCGSPTRRRADDSALAFHARLMRYRASEHELSQQLTRLGPLLEIPAGDHSAIPQDLMRLLKT